MYKWLRKPHTPKPQDTCKHNVTIAQVRYDILNGLTMIILRCVECGKVLKLSITATNKDYLQLMRDTNNRGNRAT